MRSRPGCWRGVVRDAFSLVPFRDWTTRAGLGLFLFALLLHPALEVALGRSWAQTGVFGTSPDPTVLGTLGLLLMARRRQPLLLPLPLAWCALSGATLWTMGSPGAWVLPLVGAAVLVVSFLQGPGRYLD